VGASWPTALPTNVPPHSLKTKASPRPTSPPNEERQAEKRVAVTIASARNGVSLASVLNHAQVVPGRKR